MASIDAAILSMHCQMLRGGQVIQAPMVRGPFIPDMDGPGGPSIAR